MSIAKSIIMAMEQNKDDDLFQIKNKLKSKRNLNKQDFKQLISVLQKKAIELISLTDLTVSDFNMISKGLLGARIQNFDEVLKFVAGMNSKRAPLLMHALLNKNCKIDSSVVKNYLENMILGEIHLTKLKILLVVSKNYPELLDEKIIKFCENYNHPICKELVNRHRIDFDY